jgi:hypothetical protein
MVLRSHDPEYAMTEAEWLAATDPEPMLEALQATGKVSDRKLRLFAAACCRRTWDRFPDPSNRDLVAVLEDHPDGRFEDQDIYEAGRASSRREYEHRRKRAYWAAKYLGRGFYKLTAAESAEEVAARVLFVASGEPDWSPITDVEVEEARRTPLPPAAAAEAAEHAGLLRDVVGNPFRPVAVDPTWLAWQGGTVTSLAQAAYDERRLPSGHLDTVRLAVLADALEEAGCVEADLLGHLRRPGPHVRGCWPVDLLLAKG